MGERPDAIAGHIERQREALESNLQDLETKVSVTTARVKSAADWRMWVRKQPLLMIALAFGGGFWLAFRGR